MKPEGLPKSLNVDDQLVTEKGRIRYHMNKFFAEIGKKTANSFSYSSVSHSWRQFLGPSCLKSMVFEEITVHEIKTIVFFFKEFFSRF